MVLHTKRCLVLDLRDGSNSDVFSKVTKCILLRSCKDLTMSATKIDEETLNFKCLYTGARLEARKL